MFDFVFELDDNIPMIRLSMSESVIEASNPVIGQMRVKGNTISLIPCGVIMAEISVQ